jgi:hypothetical protein
MSTGLRRELMVFGKEEPSGSAENVFLMGDLRGKKNET